MNAQSVQDSLALIGFFNLLDEPSQQTLRDEGWTTLQPINQWGGVEVRIEINGENIGVSTQLDISNRDLSFSDTAILPSAWPNRNFENINLSNNRFKRMPTLRSYTIDCSFNQLEELSVEAPGLNSLDCSNNQIENLAIIYDFASVDFLNCSNNQLKDMNIFAPVAGEAPFIAIQNLDCSNNQLTFEDFAIFSPFNIGFDFSIMNYAPQADMHPQTLYHKTGHTATLSPEYIDGATSNDYNWSKDGVPNISSNINLLFSPVQLIDGGDYQYNITNSGFPDLTLRGDIRLNVDLEEYPFDTTHIILEFDDQLDDIIKQEEYLDSLGYQKLKEFCIDGNRVLQLWEVRNLLDINTLRKGLQSRVKADTTRNAEVSPFLEIGLITSDNESIRCIHSTTNTEKSYAALMAILDTGIFMENALTSDGHSDLKDLAHLNRKEIPNNNVDDDDDCIPDNLSDIDIYNGINNIYPKIATDSIGHGTANAGIASNNYPEDIALRILDVKVFGEKGMLFDLICGIHYAIEQEVDVINISMGYYAEYPSAILYNALERAKDAGIIVVVSAGNGKRILGENIGVNIDEDEHRYWPAAFSNYESSDRLFQPLDNIITVAALDAAGDNIASYSNFGESVLVATNGTGIYTTFVENATEESYTTLSGTSMAAPAVSRLISIIIAYRPDLPYYKIIDCLRTSSSPIDNNLVAWGKLNESAVFACLGITPYQESLPTSEIIEEFEMEVYPNPFNDDLIVRLNTDSPQRATLEVRDINGVLIFREQCPLASTIYWNGRTNNGPALRPGFYIITVRLENDVSVSQKVVKY